LEHQEVILQRIHLSEQQQVYQLYEGTSIGELVIDTDALIRSFNLF